MSHVVFIKQIKNLTTKDVTKNYEKLYIKAVADQWAQSVNPASDSCPPIICDSIFSVLIKCLIEEHLVAFFKPFITVLVKNLSAQITRIGCWVCVI